MSYKNRNIIRQFPYFTHFSTIPFTTIQNRIYIQQMQQKIQTIFVQNNIAIQSLRRHSHLLSHLTLFMLTLRRQDVKNKLREILQLQGNNIQQILGHLKVRPGKVKYFTRINKNQKCNELTVVYLEIDQQSTNIINQFTDYFVRILLKHDIIHDSQLKSMRIIYDHNKAKFYPQTLHISLFRCKNLMQNQSFLQIYEQINSKQNMQSQTIFQCKTFEISTMMEYGQDQFYLPFEKIRLNEQNLKQQSIFQ